MNDVGQIDLALAERFRVGLMTAEPTLRQVSTTTTSVETIQPRVMQVLVALARANGAIISRDALVQQCWEGRIVGDDSINRVISRLRRLSEQSAAGSFRIETIAGVGYRLIGEVALVSPAPSRPLSFEDAGDRASAMPGVATAWLFNRATSFRWRAAAAASALCSWLQSGWSDRNSVSTRFACRRSFCKHASACRIGQHPAQCNGQRHRARALHIIAEHAFGFDYRLTGRLLG